MGRAILGSRRRGLVAAGTLALVGAAFAAVAGRELAMGLIGGDPGYQVVDRWQLREGGYGLYVAVKPGLTHEELKRLGEGLRAQAAYQPNAVVFVFDDPAAAKTVRTGARIVGNEAYEQAIRHQIASFVKSAGTRTSVFRILVEPETEIRY